jgi:hypothetical protein
MKLMNAFADKFAIQRFAHLLGDEREPALLVNVRGNVRPAYFRDDEPLVLGHGIVGGNGWRLHFDPRSLFL